MHKLQGKLLSRAIAIAGGVEALCALLGVDESRLRIWLDGKATWPDWLSLQVVDLILDDDIRRAAEDRRFKPRGKADGGMSSPSA